LPFVAIPLLYFSLFSLDSFGSESNIESLSFRHVQVVALFYRFGGVFGIAKLNKTSAL
jgi:hypothetical protein